ncbi:MAG: hypothetical protein WBQ73_01295 [Candidatus Babeliales bacterium]
MNVFFRTCFILSCFMSLMHSPFIYSLGGKTLVLTPLGHKKAEELRKGDYVVTIDYKKQVTKDQISQIQNYTIRDHINLLVSNKYIVHCISAQRFQFKEKSNDIFQFDQWTSPYFIPDNTRLEALLNNKGVKCQQKLDLYQATPSYQFYIIKTMRNMPFFVTPCNIKTYPQYIDYRNQLKINALPSLTPLKLVRASQ